MYCVGAIRGRSTRIMQPAYHVIARCNSCRSPLVSRPWLLRLPYDTHRRVRWLFSQLQPPSIAAAQSGTQQCPRHSGAMVSSALSCNRPPPLRLTPPRSQCLRAWPLASAPPAAETDVPRPSTPPLIARQHAANSIDLLEHGASQSLATSRCRDADRTQRKRWVKA